MNIRERVDVVIIGAGPAGLSAAIYTGRARLTTVVLEKGLPGGQILITDWIENYPGFPDGVAPFELMEGFRKQAVRFGAEIVTDEAREIVPDPDPDHPRGWLVRGENGVYPTRAIIIAAGAQYRRLGLAEEERLIGRGVSYCATCDGPLFREKIIFVVGGGNTAVDEALFLSHFAKRVFVVHRRDQLRGEKILQERAFANPKIEFVWSSVVAAIHGKSLVEAVEITDLKTHTTKILPAGAVFIAIGMLPTAGFLPETVAKDEFGFIITDRSMRTSVPGIFAAGDVVSGSLRQITTGVGEATIAVLSVQQHLDAIGMSKP